MLWEAVAAVLVGLFILLLVLEPLVRGPAAAVEVAMPDFDEADDTPKGLALAALREIEFDQATGKLSDDDYAMLKERYTARALEAMRVEEGRAGIAAPVPVAPAPATAPPCPTCATPARDGAQFCEGCGMRLVALRCHGCGAWPATDGGFCEACGSRLVAA
ncbi:MAG: zinc ribbon domain-containing protein [Gemmatimonadales bacterium]|nr:zinc ribbon domain-containing protein [Gemmatimonadales bacterium]